MSSAVVVPVIEQLQEYGETRRGWLGVRIQNVTDELADALGLEEAAGALVTDVPEGPAAESGMQSGDVILSFDGNAVEDTRELVRRVGNTAVGATVPVTVFRNGEMTTLQVTLGRRETAEAVPASAPANDPVPQEMLGIEVTGLTDDLRAQLDLPEGAEGRVVTEIDEASDAFEKGLRRGDLITEAGQERVADASDLADAIEAARDAGRTSLLLLIERAGEPRFMALPLGG
jgi:serine protease Do